MRVKGVVAVTVGKPTRNEVEEVAAREGVLDSSHARIAIDLTQLRHNEIVVEKHVEEEADLVE